jgi:hypothetical protein
MQWDWNGFYASNPSHADLINTPEKNAENA